MFARLGTNSDAIAAYVIFGGSAVLCVFAGARLYWRPLYVLALALVVAGLFFANDAGDRQHNEHVAAEAKSHECQAVLNYVNAHSTATANHCDNARPTVWVVGKTCDTHIPLAYQVTKSTNNSGSENREAQNKVELGFTEMNGNPLDTQEWLTWSQIGKLFDLLCYG